MTYPHCGGCVHQVPPWHMNNCHYNMERSCLGRDRQRRSETLQQFFEAIQVSMVVHLYPLDSVSAFPCLGHTIVFNNSNWVVLYQNMRNTQRHWGMVPGLMVKAGETVQARSVFYKALVQAVLICGGEI